MNVRLTRLFNREGDQDAVVDLFFGAPSESRYRPSNEILTVVASRVTSTPTLGVEFRLA
jgi:hypothetical protein